MSDDANWVEDVRRWYFNGTRAAGGSRAETVRPVTRDEAPEVGYEAANPALQSSAWSTPARSRFSALS